ncbi:MAG: hypothetical protein RR555_02365 [Bacteroidales bacterium]
MGTILEEHNKQIQELIRATAALQAARIERRQHVADLINTALEKKQWTKDDFMKALGKKNYTEMNKWLSGTHNFTLDVLVEIELALSIQIIKRW